MSGRSRDAEMTACELFNVGDPECRSIRVLYPVITVSQSQASLLVCRSIPPHGFGGARLCTPERRDLQTRRRRFELPSAGRRIFGTH